MKDLFRKIASLTMALLLLASTTSWTIEKHYCLGHVMDIAVFHEAEGCGMEMTDATSDIKMDCCEDEVTFVEGQDDLKISFDDLNIGQQFFLVAYTYSYIDLFEGLTEQVVPHKEYPPPNLVADIQLLDQVFLI